MTSHPLPLAALAERVTEDDGCLPNGCARSVDSAGWSAFLADLRARGWPVTWDGEPIADWPETAEDVGREDCPALQVRPSDSVRIRVFPSWGTDSIWFDFDVREMKRQQDADSLFAFVQMVGQAAQRVVDLSYEGFDEMVFARYDPAEDTMLWLGERRG